MIKEQQLFIEKRDIPSIGSFKKHLHIVVFGLLFLSACSVGQAAQPGLLEVSSGLSSSLSSNQELPKSTNESLELSDVANSPQDSENNLGISVDPVSSPVNAEQENNNSISPADSGKGTSSVNPGGGEMDSVVTSTVSSKAGEIAVSTQPIVDLSIPVGSQIGNRAPDFNLKSLDGSMIGLPDLYGKYLLINYWATWCVPCKEELPILERLYQEYKSRGLLILSVDAIEQDTMEKLQAVINQVGTSYPTLLDQGNQFADAYQAIFFPTSFFIDPSGVIRDITLGNSSEAVFRQKIEKLLSGVY